MSDKVTNRNGILRISYWYQHKNQEQKNYKLICVWSSECNNMLLLIVAIMFKTLPANLNCSLNHFKIPFFKLLVIICQIITPQLTKNSCILKQLEKE